MSADSVTDRVAELARYRGMEESAVIQEAVESGIAALYRDMIVGRYLDGELSREQAVTEIGADRLAQVDAAQDAVETDLTWALEQ